VLIFNHDPLHENHKNGIISYGQHRDSLEKDSKEVKFRGVHIEESEVWIGSLLIKYLRV